MATSRKTLLAAVLIAGTATGRVAHADPQVSRAVVAAELAGFEHAPDAATVRGWGGDGVRWLQSLASDATALHHVRLRAVYALGHFGADAREGRGVRTFLRAFAAAPGQGLFLQRAALDALVEGFDDVATVAGYLRDPRDDVRDGAAWALARSRSSAARAALATALQTEPDPNVRLTLATALQRPSR